MPYIFNWQDPEHTIIRVDIEGQVTWEEYNLLTDRIAEELSNSNHRIDLIYNDKVGMPKGNPLPHLKSSLAQMSAHDTFGIIASVSSRSVSSFTKVMVDIMMRAYQIDRSHDGGWYATVEQAIDAINRSRSGEKITGSAH
jgi:hypothetical protein